MTLVIDSFEQYHGMYKRIINSIELDDQSIKMSSHDTSLKNPLSFDDTIGYRGNQLFINRKYYKRHKREIKLLVIDTLKNTTQYTVSLGSSEFVCDETFDAVINNPHVKELKVCRERPLNKEEIDRLLSSDIYKLRCTINFKDDQEMLYYFVPGLEVKNYPMVAGVTISDFGNERVDLIVGKNLTSKQLGHLKILFDKYPQEKVKISFRDFSKVKKVMDVIKADKILITNDNWYTKEQYRFFEEHYDNVAFDLFGGTEISPKRLREKEEFLELIINEVKAIDLSPLEQYIYLYNIVKMYKEYKEVPYNEDRAKSRRSVFTLFNDYMVCVGYATLLDELVTKLANPHLTTCEYSCTIKDEKIVGHSKVLTRIKDDKYGIDGVYISDPTWDSVKYYKSITNDSGQREIDYTTPTADIDRYNHLLMTKEEIEDEKIEYALPDATDVLFSFNYGKEENAHNDFAYYCAQDCIQKLFNIECDTKEDMIDVISTINQPVVSGNTIFSAVKNVYSKICFNDNAQIEAMMQKTLHNNDIYQNKEFNNTANKFAQQKIKTH